MTVTTSQAANNANNSGLPINPTNDPSLYAPATQSGSSTGSFSGDFNFFLKMLTTQLQNQDPTNPMDVDQMTAQIAQYSEVEQQVETNTNLTTLINASKQSPLTSAVGYIGKQVDFTNSATNTDGTQAPGSSTMEGGEAVFSYSLPSAAATATITIKDAAGNVVFTGNGQGNAGDNVALWDGINSSTGAQEPDGIYTFTVKAADSSGGAIQATTFNSGVVDSIQTDASGNILLMSGTQQFNFNTIANVRNAPPALNTGSNDTTGGGTDTTSGSTT